MSSLQNVPNGFNGSGECAVIWIPYINSTQYGTQILIARHNATTYINIRSKNGDGWFPWFAISTESLAISYSKKFTCNVYPISPYSLE